MPPENAMVPGTVEHLLRSCPPGKETLFDLVRELDPEGKPVGRLLVQTVERPKEPSPEPRRAESPPRAHTFFEAAAFAQYLADRGAPETVVLADVRASAMVAVLDDQADRGFELIRFEVQPHPLWEAWEQLLACQDGVELREFARFVMTRRRQIREPDGRELAITLNQVTATKKITRQVGQGVRAVNGLVIETQIQGTAREIPVELPDSLTLELPLVLGGTVQTIHLDLLVQAGEDGIVVHLAAPGAAEARLATFEALVEEVRRLLPYDRRVIVGLGRIAHGTWKYLPA